MAQQIARPARGDAARPPSLGGESIPTPPGAQRGGSTVDSGAGAGASDAIPRPPGKRAEAKAAKIKKKKKGGGDSTTNLGANPGSDVDSLIEKEFRGLLDGSKSSFSDERMAMMKQGLLETTKGQAAASRKQALADAALTGTFRSGTTQRRLQDIDTSSRSQFTKGVRGLMIEKAKAEAQDRLQGLQMAQSWLKSKRDYDLGKKQIAAQIQSARIQAGATVAAAKLSADATRAAAGASAGAARYAAELGHSRWQAEFAFNAASSNVNQAQQDILSTLQTSGLL